MKQLYFFIGTNAELFKIAPVIAELRRRHIPFKLITTGQNKLQFSKLEDFTGHLKPDIALTEKVNKSSVINFALWTLKTILKCLFSLRDEFRSLKKNNICLIIHGDTVSSSLGAFLAKWYGLKLVRIEAGYFSHHLLEPFPEEICRNINSFLADVEFPPTNWTLNNLKKFKGIHINTKYNTIIEIMRWGLKQKDQSKVHIKGKYYLLIMHRQEHVIFRRKWTQKIMEFIINNASNDLTCVLLNHPLTEQVIRDLGLTNSKKIKIISQLSYPEFIQLMNNSEFLAADGATFQQETYYLGKPFLILRNYTEQSEGLGRNALLSKGSEKKMKEFLDNYQKYKQKPIIPTIAPSKIIVDYLIK